MYPQLALTSVGTRPAESQLEAWMPSKLSSKIKSTETQLEAWMPSMLSSKIWSNDKWQMYIN